MGKQFTFTPGQIKDEKNVTPTDAPGPGQLNATFGGSDTGVFANCIMVGAAGNVSVLFCDKTAAETITGLAAGIWQSRKPFKHVYAANTSATGIRVGITF